MMSQQPQYQNNAHLRQGKKVESSASHMMQMSQNPDSSKVSSSKTHSSKSKKEVRPQSGGIQHKQFSKQSETRSRMQNQHHNMSMFDKIGAHNKNQHSPPGPIDFHGKQL